MDSALPEPASPAGVPARRRKATCRYCGAVLNPAYYFCLVCATPYKKVEWVLSPAIPRVETEGERLAVEALARERVVCEFRDRDGAYLGERRVRLIRLPPPEDPEPPAEADLVPAYRLAVPLVRGATRIRVGT